MNKFQEFKKLKKDFFQKAIFLLFLFGFGVLSFSLVFAARDFKIQEEATGIPIFFVEGDTGFVGIGTDAPDTSLSLPNDGWISAKNVDGTGYVNMFKVGPSNQIEVGGTLNIGTISLTADSGAVTLVNMPVTSASPLGTEQSYSFSLDSDVVLKVYSESDGTGGIQNKRIGINTISPAVELDVDGDGTLEGRLTAGSVNSFGGITANNSGSYVSGYGLYVGGSEDNYFAGNVGIGTASPDYNFHILGDSLDNVVQAKFESNSDGYAPASILLEAGHANSRGQGVFMYNSVSDDSYFWGVPYNTGTDRVILGYLNQATWNQNLAQNSNALLTIKNDGNVGIGTTSPGARLETRIASDAGIPLIVRKEASANPISRPLAVFYHNFTSSQNNQASTLDFYGDNTGVAGESQMFARMSIIMENSQTVGTGEDALGAMGISLADGSGSAVERVRINSGGNVGIGTTNPTAGKLQIHGGNIALTPSGSNYITGLATPGSTDLTYAATVDYVNEAVGGIQPGVGLWTASGNDIYNSNTGNVGVGSTNPQYKLDVSGTARFGDHVRMDSGKNLVFYDHNATYPTATGGFLWDLNNDSAKIYAQQPSSDRIDFVFKITDNVGTTDRFVHWIDSYTGEADDAYPLLMDGEKVVFNYPTVFGAGNSKNMDFYIMGDNESSLTNAYFFGDATNKRIGISSTSPAAKLDINGNVQAPTYYDRDDSDYFLNPAAGGTGWSLYSNGSIYASGVDDNYFAGNIELAATKKALLGPSLSSGNLNMITESQLPSGLDSGRGWVVSGGTGTVEEVNFIDGKKVRAMKLVSSGNSYIYTPRVKVDPNKTYKFSVWIKTDSPGTGSRYFGLYAFNSSNSQIGVLTSGGTENTNPYFWNGDPNQNKWTYFETYLYPTGSADAPGGWRMDEDGNYSGVIGSYKWNANTEDALIRLLNWGNSGVTITDYFYMPRIVEVGEGQSITDSRYQMGDTYITGSLSADNGDVTTDGLGNVAAESYYDGAYYLDPDLATTSLNVAGSVNVLGTTNDNYFAGDVGIGIANPDARLEVLNSSNYYGQKIIGSGTYPLGSAETTYGLYIDNDRYGGENESVTYGVYSKAQGSSGNNHYIYGVYGLASTHMKYSGREAIGVYGHSYHDYDSGTTTGGDLIGVKSKVEFKNDSTIFTVADGVGFLSQAVVPTNKTLTNYYGLFLDTPSGSGTITNKYGIYQKDSNSINYFAGNVGIGTTSPTTSPGGIDSGTTVLQIGDNGASEVAELRLAGGNTLDVSSRLVFDNSVSGDGMSISFTSDTSPYGLDGLLFVDENGGNVVMKINRDDGNVGIGTTIPGALLDVDGGTGQVVDVSGGRIMGLNLIPTSDSEAVPRKYLHDNFAPITGGTGSAFVQGGNTFGGLATLGTNDNYDLTFETNGSRKMTILTGGNVGIGTTGPATKLHLYQANSNVFQTFGISSVSYDTGLKFLASDTSERFAIVSNVDSTANNDLLLFQEQGNNVLAIKGDGFVGIGTTVPSQKLEVNGNLRLTTSGNQLQFTNTNVKILRDGNAMRIDSYDGWRLYDMQGSAERVRITNTGNVGIGTTSPDYTLHTYTPTASGSSYLQVDRQADTEAVGLVLATAGTPDWYNYVTADANRSLIWNDGLTDLMTLTNDGYLGIGPDYTSPNALLDVNNKFLVSDSQVTVNVPLNLASAGDISFASDLIFTNSTSASIKSQSPLYITAGDASQNVDLTLRASNLGEVVVDDILRVVNRAYLEGGATFSGGLDMNDYDITGVDKLTVTTIDPIHEINGKEYATFVSFYAGGQKMETSGLVNLIERNKKEFLYILDFENLEEGSDLWLFWETIHQDLEKLIITLTPGFNGRAWYQKRGDSQIVIFGDQLGEVSYTLTAPRYDYKKWPNLISKTD